MDLQERINRYWSKRSDEFADARYQEFHSDKKIKWLDVIRRYIPKKKEIRALDIGTGTGFFAFCLRDLGCKVTGIDASDAMIENAKKLSRDLNYNDIDFLSMDAQKLKFDNNSFDFIFTRNVTWILPDPVAAYEEMYRVLDTGGRLLNFDANYGMAFKKADENNETERSAVTDCNSKYKFPAQSLEMLRERNDLAKQLYICEKNRPFWDAEVLGSIGIRHIELDLAIGEYINETKEDLWTNPSPLFMVMARKD